MKTQVFVVRNLGKVAEQVYLGTYDVERAHKLATKFATSLTAQEYGWTFDVCVRNPNRPGKMLKLSDDPPGWGKVGPAVVAPESPC